MKGMTAGSGENAEPQAGDALPFLRDGELGGLMSMRDWSTSPLGAPATWPQSLRSVVGLMLGSRYPMFVAWGDALTFLYNDAYVPILGAKHPRALGLPFATVWSEIWADIEGLVTKAMAGEATFHENLHLTMERNGYPEDTWYSFSYSPVRDESGLVAGMFCVCTETTAEVVAGRRRAEETNRQRRMFEQAPGFICTLQGPEHVFDFVNNTHKRLFGSGAWVGRSIRDAFPDLAGQGFYELLDRVYQTGERHVAHGAPARFRLTPGGAEEERFLDFIFEPVRDEAGRITGIFCEGHDATDRILADQAMRATSAKESFLVALGDALRLMSDPGEIVAATTRALGERLGATRVVYADIDEPGEVAATQGDWTDGTAAHLPDRIAVADFGETLIAALHTGDTLVVPDVRAHPATADCLPALAAIGVGALISVPLVKGGRFAANLNVHSRVPRTWTPPEIELAEAVADRTWDVLARARAVKALAGREQELHTLTDALPVLIAYVDREERYRFNNKAYEDWFGLRRETIYGRPVREVVGDAAYKGLKPQIDRALSGQRFSFEQLVPYKDAGARHVHVNYVPRWGAGGEVEGYYSLIQDVTESRAAQAALSESETRFRNLADNSPLMMWVTDPSGHCTYLNTRWYEFTGQAPGAGEGYGWLDAVHPEDRPVAEAAFLSANAERRNYEVDLRFRRADGVYRWAIDAAAARFTDSGEYIGYVGSVIDIDERKGAEQALAVRVVEQTAERNRVWEMSRDLFAIMGFDGYLKAINPAWEPTLGRDTATLLQLPFSEQVHPDDHAAVKAVIKVLQGGESVDRFEDRLRHADGSWRWISWALVPEGDVFYAVGRDVTAARAAAEELEQAQEALRQSQKMEAVGQLTGGLAHDFNNLLAGISGSLEMMQTRIAQGRIGDLDRYMIGAQGAAKRAAALTHRLLAFSRRQTLEPKATDVNRLVAELEDLIRRTVGPAIELECVAKGGLWSTLVDPNQLENALLNLCINARDAMPDGGRLTIETANRWPDERAAKERDLPPGQYVSICVSDNGTGMSADVVERAFDPFFTTKPIGLGTGLGLSMIYGFARQSGGQVRIYSEVGQGTMVCVYLPRHHGEEGAEMHAAPEEVGRADAGETVLVIDDEPLVRMLVVDVLEDLGYVAIEAADGPSGLKVIRSDSRIDLLITDVGLPNGMNGRQVADAAREVRPDLKVLFVTGYAENAVLSHGHLDPGMQVVTKPFDMNALAGRIKSMIAGG